MWPLLALASAMAGPAALQLDGNWLRIEIESGSLLDVHVDEQGLRLCLRKVNGELLHEAIVAAWGDQHSEAFWFPFEELEAEAHREPVDLGEIVARAKDLLSRVRFFDNEPIIAPAGREAAAIDYLRLTSGVIGEWTISMAAPHELILDDPSTGESDGLVLSFGELPPGLAELGECALVQLEPGPVDRWWMRPAMCSFGDDLSGLTTSAARERLHIHGFTVEEITQLDRTAEMVRANYAAEAVGEHSGVYTG